jgi:hypothetical protein
MPPQAIFNNCQNNKIFPGIGKKFSHTNTRAIHHLIGLHVSLIIVVQQNYCCACKRAFNGKMKVVSCTNGLLFPTSFHTKKVVLFSPCQMKLCLPKGIFCTSPKPTLLATK